MVNREEEVVLFYIEVLFHDGSSIRLCREKNNLDRDVEFSATILELQQMSIEIKSRLSSSN